MAQSSAGEAPNDDMYAIVLRDTYEHRVFPKYRSCASSSVLETMAVVRHADVTAWAILQSVSESAREEAASFFMYGHVAGHMSCVVVFAPCDDEAKARATTALMVIDGLHMHTSKWWSDVVTANNDSNIAFIHFEREERMRPIRYDGVYPFTETMTVRTHALTTRLVRMNVEWVGAIYADETADALYAVSPRAAGVHHRRKLHAAYDTLSNTSSASSR